MRREKKADSATSRKTSRIRAVPLDNYAFGFARYIASTASA